MEYYQTRYQKRKKKRFNLLLNMLIAVVVLLIIYFSIGLFSPKSEEAAVISEEQELIEDSTTDSQEEKDVQEERETTETTTETTETTTETTETTEQEREEETPIQENGEWKPIGTTQSEPFEAQFVRDSVNWNEMTRALQYATGLGENMIIWRLGNGGDLQSAVGTVSDSENRDTPYQVRLEWVPNEGWLPVEKIKLDENPYN